MKCWYFVPAALVKNAANGFPAFGICSRIIDSKDAVARGLHIIAIDRATGANEYRQSKSIGAVEDERWIMIVLSIYSTIPSSIPAKAQRGFGALRSLIGGTIFAIGFRARSGGGKFLNASAL